MLIGYVSDERYVALPDVLFEFVSGTDRYSVRSTASGVVDADLPPGRYRVTLAAAGFGPKRVELELPASEPRQFRLLSGKLLGYAWPKWVQSGEKSEFRIHASQAYKLSLWRYGWNKELVRKIGWFDEHGPDATRQITPDGDYTQTGAQWNKFGYASPHHKQLIEAPDRSGLYYFHAKTEAGEFFSFPWIVAPRSPQSRIALLASNITWNAYNSFGGRSNYIHADGVPPTPTVNARLELKRYTNPRNFDHETTDYDPLSFDRPEPINHIPEDVGALDPIEGRAACHIAPTEWRLAAWLEREGFAYDYYAETQLHSGVLDLDRYRVLVISTHPEYWSRTMYDKVKSWVFERGGRLVYLGGNGLNCEVEFVNESTCIYRNGDCRILSEPGCSIESRLHLRYESEANLLGVVYNDKGIMTAAPYEALETDHWVFAGTGLTRGAIFGRNSLHERVPGGASGHETDKRSASSPANTQLLARGLNANSGGAEMVIHEPPNGGAVFSVGSICWTSSVLVDPAVSQITANVVRKFSADERFYRERPA